MVVLPTPEMPTETGYYWVKQGREVEMVQVVHIDTFFGEFPRLSVWRMQNDEVFTNADFEGAELAGPIPRPLN